MSAQTQHYIELHESGLSTREIAEKLGVTKNGVISVLRYWGKCRRAPGVEWEDKVESAMTMFGHDVQRMPGDHPFDFVIDGQHVEVKSAASHVQNKYGTTAYGFDINHKDSAVNNLPLVDYYLLVFTDKPLVPMYRLDAREVTAKSYLKIPSSLNTKYNLVWVGNLEN